MTPRIPSSLALFRLTEPSWWDKSTTTLRGGISSLLKMDVWLAHYTGTSAFESERALDDHKGTLFELRCCRIVKNRTGWCPALPQVTHGCLLATFRPVHFHSVHF